MGSNRPRTDRWSALLAGAAAGDRTALDLLLRELLPWTFVVARSALGDEADAWDVAQETALRLCQSAPTYDPCRSSARTWVGRIVRNQVIDVLRRRSKRRLQGLGSHDPGSDRDDPATAAERAEECGLVRQALGALKPAERAALLLRYEAGLSYAELGQALGVPFGTAATRVHRGIASLRARLRS
jgi:RNA polymerase sigma-70 factor (ECF subfamily)